MTGPMLQPDRPAVLIARALSKQYPGVCALDAVDFTLERGEIHALLGENGAGKSTLIRCLTGAERADAGDILLDGEPVQPRSPAHAQSIGISPVYQEVNLVATLSVAENLALGREPRRWFGLDRRAMRDLAHTALARLGLEMDVDRPLSEYSIALRQMVAIARAIDFNARVLILDEPTSSLDAQETERLFRIMRHLRDDGIGIIFITHFLDQVESIADRMTVLRNGKRVGTFDAATTTRLDLVQHMLGRAIDDDEHHAALERSKRICRSSGAKPILRVRDLGRRNAVSQVSFDLHAGELLGVAGLLGSGRTELLRLIFALDRAETGSVHLRGQVMQLTQPRQALRANLAMLTEERKHDGLIEELSVRENMVLALQAKRGWWKLSRRRQREIAARFIAALGIQTPSSEQPIRFLSGGNQQKALLARALATEPVILLLDEPTRGIDLGARAEIEKLIRELRDGGMAMLLVSAELADIARLSDRALVLRDRSMAADIPREDLSTQRLLHAISAPHAARERAPA